MFVEVVQKVLAFLSELVRIGATSRIMDFQDSTVYPIVSMAIKMDKFSGIGIFPHLVLGSIMAGTEHELLKKFVKSKLRTF